jgi:hypothetical protein
MADVYFILSLLNLRAVSFAIFLNSFIFRFKTRYSLSVLSRPFFEGSGVCSFLCPIGLFSRIEQPCGKSMLLYERPAPRPRGITSLIGIHISLKHVSLPGPRGSGGSFLPPTVDDIRKISGVFSSFYSSTFRQ